MNRVLIGDNLYYMTYQQFTSHHTTVDVSGDSQVDCVVLTLVALPRLIFLGMARARYLGIVVTARRFQ